jgi:deoxyribonucleoside regulator
MLTNTSQGNIPEGKLLSDDRFLRRVAQLYYEDGQTQEAIAEMEFCSRQAIGKALQKARDRGIVRISVIPEQRTGYLRNLSRDLRVALGLEDLVIVAGRNLNEIPPGDTAEDVLADIATTAADYLDQLLTDSDILAVSGGRNIMRNVVRYLKPTKLLPNLQVVPTIGFVEPHTNLGDSNLIAYDIAIAYGAKHAWLPIPAIVETREQCEQARALPLVRDVLKTIEQANVVMMGLWPTHFNDDLVARGVLHSEQINALQSHDAVMDINHWAFDAKGRCINYDLPSPSYYLTGLEIPRLRDRIRNDKAKVILVAGASLSYASGIRAALKAGIANILITDHVTAQLLMKPESD